jgi:hypothetical protein
VGVSKRGDYENQAELVSSSSSVGMGEVKNNELRKRHAVGLFIGLN